MRFFMYLPPCNEKAQSVPLPAEVTFFMQNQAVPTYYHVLKLGLGLGGILNILCIPAIADATPIDSGDLESGDIGAIETPPEAIETVTATQVVAPQPEAIVGDVAPSRRGLLQSESSFVREPKLSTSGSKKVSSSPENNLEIRAEASTASVLGERTSTNASGAAALMSSSKLERHPKPEPWSVAKLMADGDSGSSQRLSVSEIRHSEVERIDLSWGDETERDPSQWIDELAQTPSDHAPQSTPNHMEGSDVSDVTLSDVTPSESVLSAPITPDSVSEDTVPSDTVELTSLSEDEDVSGDGGRDEDARDKTDEDGLTVEIDSPDLLSEILEDQGVVTEVYPVLDEELGTLRMVQLRSRQNEELGILRILRTAQAAPAKPKAPIAYLGGRLGFVDVDNVIRSDARVDEQIYQAGAAFYFVPKLSESTSLYAISETNIARYDNISNINYNEVQLQVGVRQRLRPRTFAQIGWRNQRLYSPGYRDKLFGVNYIDAVVSHRSILSSKVWLDSFYQMRLGFADPQAASRFRQTMTLSLNYGVTRDLRTSLLYQLDFDDYTQIPRYDTYQQILGIVSYNITPESRLSLFGGTRFGTSSSPRVNLDDTFYGAGLNVSVPLF